MWADDNADFLVRLPASFADGAAYDDDDTGTRTGTNTGIRTTSRAHTPSPMGVAPSAAACADVQTGGKASFTPFTDFTTTPPLGGTPGGGKGDENTGRWSKKEHDLFVECLTKYGKDWKKAADLLKTRTAVQIRTHAQKYFQRVAKLKGDSIAESTSFGGPGGASRQGGGGGTNKVTHAFKDDDGNWVTGATKVSMGKTWLPFDDARDFVRTLKLDSLRAWYEYAKSGKRPDNIPSHPEIMYRGAGWVSLPDWMGYVSF